MRSFLGCTLLACVASEGGPQTPKHWGSPRFDGKKVLVIGGDSGIGLATVEAFYFECASVMMIGHNPQKTAEAAANVTAFPPPVGCKTPANLQSLAVDISNATAVKEMTAKTFRELGGFDIAVNNAGVSTSSDIMPGTEGFEEKFAKSPEMKVNLDGTVWCMHEQLKVWKENNKPGVMVNVASIAGETAFLPFAYSTSKWAMVGFTKNAALKYAPYGIRINAVAPGAVDTPMLRNGLPEDDPRWKKIKEGIEKLIPDGHISDPWEMAGVITFLASDMSHYVVGQVITADGGFTLAPPGAQQSFGVSGQESLVV